jgi:hypothetical protein
VVLSGPELEDELHGLETQLDAGLITEAQLVAAIRARLTRTFTARCRLRESHEERQAFLEELERARAAFAETPLARELEAARRSRHLGDAELR